MAEQKPKTMKVTEGNIVFDDKGKKTAGQVVSLPADALAKLKKAGVVK